MTSIHPGLSAEKAASELGVSKREQKKAHRAAMKAFQDNFYYDVASRHGLTRLGKSVSALSATSGRPERRMRRPLAEAGRRQRKQALKLVDEAELLAKETIALVWQNARVQIDAAETEAKSRVAVAKEKATKYANDVVTEFAALKRKLHDADAPISAQAEEIAQLREPLRRDEAAPSTP